eukprot:TRINITY_DN3817_c0_g2_i1.p1 TRINITY_DN3817_c0_g2~~TRINITY_DN3817_c0_g2_i1.p1  ORF type:complete len:334 (+),score=63.14 TRINITY_DN3817_c0_g2_i1:101-1102(+)
MKAYVVKELVSSPLSLSISEVEEPSVSENELEVKVCSIGLNFFETLMIQGKYQSKPSLPFIPGTEFSGIVSKIGGEVTRFKVGDLVFGSTMQGAYAEKVVVTEDNVFLLPQTMTLEQGAAFSLNYGTSYAALVYRAQLKRGEYLLVNAGAGGVSTAAIQIAKALGAHVISTVGSVSKVSVAKEAGADSVIDLETNSNLVQAINDLTNGKGVDVVFDPVGGDLFSKLLQCIAWNGRVIVVGFASGKIPQVPMNRVLLKNCAILGVFWGAYQVYEPEKIAEAFKALFTMFNAGQIKPILFPKVFDFTQLPQALSLISDRKSTGKVIVNVRRESKL